MMLCRHVKTIRHFSTVVRVPPEVSVQEPSIKLTPEERKTKDGVPSELTPGDKKTKDDTLGLGLGSKAAPSAPSRPLSHYLDTYHTIVRLQGAGYSVEQAEVLVRVMIESLQNLVAPIEGFMLSQKDLELMELRLLRELEGTQGNLTRLEHTTIESLKNENQVLKDKVEKLMSGFKEEVTKVKSDLQLDLNLEKGRIKEEASGVLKQVNDTNNRIDKEVAQIKTQIETQKLESIKYLVGMSLSMLTILLSVAMGVWRLMK